MTPRQSPIQRDLCRLAADHHLGAFLNSVDALGTRYGGVDVIPSATYRAVMALWSMLADLELTDAGRPIVAEVWRDL